MAGPSARRGAVLDARRFPPKRRTDEGDTPMTEHERKIAVLLTGIIQGNLTVSQLRRRVEDGKAQVKKLCLGRASKKQLDAIAAGEEALARIERERLKYDRQKSGRTQGDLINSRITVEIATSCRAGI
jgi:hypothetical protein